MSQAFDEVVEAFELFDDWEDRYRYLIELGRKETGLPEAAKVPANKVEGCVSQVWLTQQRRDDGALVLRGDSDAHIVRGLVAVLLRLFSGRRPEEILAVDARRELGRLDLEGHLTPSRSNGLFAMVGRVRALASAALAR
ncbi:MAG TPA: SufE family protein [Kiloniellales bacterium]|nr:SufE family protein [Kiloniellales bacterium]